VHTPMEPVVLAATLCSSPFSSWSSTRRAREGVFVTGSGIPLSRRSGKGAGLDIGSDRGGAHGAGTGAFEKVGRDLELI
jgi:hypothetical protein